MSRAKSQTQTTNRPVKPDAIALLSALSTPPSADTSTCAQPSKFDDQQPHRMRQTKPGARANTRQIAGHFPEATMRALKFVMAEEDTTLQALLDEAIHDLLVKKGRTKLAAP